MSRSSMSWDDIRNRSIAQGLPTRELFVIITRPTGDLDDIDLHVEPHIEYQLQLEREGVMFAAGPLGEIEGKSWNGTGLVIVRAANLAEAEAIAAADPMHQAGARSYTIQPWLFNEGRPTL